MGQDEGHREVRFDVLFPEYIAHNILPNQMEEELIASRKRALEVESDRDKANLLLVERNAAFTTQEQTFESKLHEAQSRHKIELAAKDAELTTLRAELHASISQRYALEDDKQALRAALDVVINAADRGREHARLQAELSALQDASARQADELAACRAEAAASRAAAVEARERERAAYARSAALQAECEHAKRSVEELVASNTELYAETLTLRHMRTAAGAGGDSRGVAK